MAEPGMVAKGIAALFQKNSPLAIKFRVDPALWSWLVHFALRCNHRDMVAAARGIQPLLESSLELYRELIEREHLECEWQKKGLLFAYRSKASMDAYAATDHLLAESFHCPARRYDGDALEQFEPALKPGLAGAWYYEDDAHLRPDRLLRSWRDVLARSGVAIYENCAFRSFRRQNGRAVAALTDQEGVVADAFVIATGAWTPLLNTELGCQGADPARQGLQPDHAEALDLPLYPDHLPRDPRGGDAV